MKYLKKFVTKAQYDAFMETDVDFPFVAYIVENKQLKYMSENEKYEFFNVLQGDGKAYIKTKYYISNYDRVSVTFDKNGVSELVFGLKCTPLDVLLLPNQSAKAYAAWQGNAMLVSCGKRDVSIGMYESNGVYAAKIDSSAGTTILNNYGAAPAEVVSTFPLHVFTTNLKDTFEVDTRIYTGGISQITITDSRTGKVKLELRPAVKNGTEAGMMDMVTGNFFGNANSEGLFTVI